MAPQAARWAARHEYRAELPDLRRSRRANRTAERAEGFDAAGRPAEVFLSGAKDGSGLAAILGDAAVVISVALQHRVSAAALSKSIARLPASIDEPPTAPASPIGAALDLWVAQEGLLRESLRCPTTSDPVFDPNAGQPTQFPSLIPAQPANPVPPTPAPESAPRTPGGGRNVPNYRYDASHTAGGYYQAGQRAARAGLSSCRPPAQRA